MAGIMTAPFYRALGFDRDGDRRDRAVLAGRDAGRHHVGRLAGGAHRRRPRAAVDRLGADHRDGDVRAAGRVRPATTACCMRTVATEAFAAGHGRRGVHHLPVGSLLRGVHRDALRVAVVARRADGAHAGRAFPACWRRRWAGRGSMRCATFAALPAMLLMMRLLRRYPPAERGAGGGTGGGPG